MITKEYLQKELATRIKGIKPGVETTTDLVIGEMKSILVLVEALQDDEKKYNNALERIKEYYNMGGQPSRADLECIFPELRESEDERIRKTIVATIEQCPDDFLNPKNRDKMLAYLEKQKEPEDKGEISDGYHTFNELYYYRMLYNAAFFNLLPKEWVHKSKKHHDGEECFGGGWFIVMANLPTGQISNHYELKDWNLFQIPEKEIADEWDGHSPQEAAERLNKYLQDKQKKQKPAEWSEKDEENLGQVISGRYLPLGLREWFCGLPERFSSRPSWKPSKEQMEALKSFLDYHRPIRNGSVQNWQEFDNLESLYEHLKKWNDA